MAFLYHKSDVWKSEKKPQKVNTMCEICANLRDQIFLTFSDFLANPSS